MKLLLGNWKYFLSQCHCRERAPALLSWASTTAVILLQVPQQVESILPLHIITSLDWLESSLQLTPPLKIQACFRLGI